MTRVAAAYPARRATCRSTGPSSLPGNSPFVALAVTRAGLARPSQHLPPQRHRGTLPGIAQEVRPHGHRGLEGSRRRRDPVFGSSPRGAPGERYRQTAASTTAPDSPGVPQAILFRPPSFPQSATSPGTRPSIRANLGLAFADSVLDVAGPRLRPRLASSPASPPLVLGQTADWGLRLHPYERRNRFPP